MKRALLILVVLATGCALIPVRPVAQRARAEKVTCEKALIFYGDGSGRITGSRWGKICSDGSIR